MNTDQLRGEGRAKPLSYWAAQLGCSMDTMRRAVATKELLAYRHPTARGRPYMATAEDVNAFLIKRRGA